MMTSSGSARSVKSTLSARPMPAGNHDTAPPRGVAVGRCRRRVLVGARALSAVTLHFRKWHLEFPPYKVECIWALRSGPFLSVGRERLASAPAAVFVSGCANLDLVRSFAEHDDGDSP